MILIDLQPTHIEYAKKIGQARFANARRGGMQTSNNGANSIEHDVRGALAETAAYVWLRLKPADWERAVSGYTGKVADLAKFIDVKAIQNPEHCLIVQMHDPAEWAYLLVDGSQHPQYKICGWLWGHEAQAHPVTDPVGDRPAHFVKQWLLHNPLDLLAEVRTRQNGR